MNVTICIPGEPRPKKTPQPVIGGRRIKVGGQTAVLNATIVAAKEAETRDYEAALARQIAARLPEVATPPEALAVDYLFVLPRPQRIPKRTPGLSWAPVKPDTDNLVKAAQDALTVAARDRWGDDAKIVVIRAAKAYAELDGQGPRTVIRVTEATPIEGMPAWFEALAAFDHLDGLEWEDM